MISYVGLYLAIGVLFLLARRTTISHQEGFFAFVFVFYTWTMWPFLVIYKFLDVLSTGDL